MKSKRPLVIAAVVVVCAVALVGVGNLYLSWRLHRSLAAINGERAELQFTPLAVPQGLAERWGGGEVAALAAGSGSLVCAGGFGVRDGATDLSPGLPGLRVAALALWRGRPIAGLEAGGLFLRREDHWEELRSGFGILHVRALAEGPGGDLLIGAREGLFTVAWGARMMERLDRAPVRTLALAEGGAWLVGGERGLCRLDGARTSPITTPDPWVDWVGVLGKEVVALTPLGLVRGPLGGDLLPLGRGEEVGSAAVLGSQVFAVSDGRLLRFESSGRPAEEFPPLPPRRVLTAAGVLFVDTDAGLYRRTAQGWTLAQARPASLPPGPCHISALALQEGNLVAGLFDGGLAVAAPRGPGLAWSAVPGSGVWGVNALLPAGGALYVASLRGAARFDGHHLTALEGGNGAAFSLAATGDGVAVGYGQGVLLPGSRFLSAFHGLPGNQALALAAGPQLFVGTPSGLGAIQAGRVAWRVTGGEGKLPNPWITALALRGEDLFIGTYGGGVTRRTAHPDTVVFQNFPETDGLKVNPGCLVLAGDRLYLGSDGAGLFRLSADGRFRPIRASLPSRHITAILAGADCLWVGTDEGLARIPLNAPEEGA